MLKGKYQKRAGGNEEYVSIDFSHVDVEKEQSDTLFCFGNYPKLGPGEGGRLR